MSYPFNTKLNNSKNTRKIFDFDPSTFSEKIIHQIIFSRKWTLVWWAQLYVSSTSLSSIHRNFTRISKIFYTIIKCVYTHCAIFCLIFRDVLNQLIKVLGKSAGFEYNCIVIIKWKKGKNVLGDSPCIYDSYKKRSTAADRRTEKRNSSKKFKKKKQNLKVSSVFTVRDGSTKYFSFMTLDRYEIFGSLIGRVSKNAFW